ncbi:MAG TPA: HD-GYP domain-containing protein [Magnetospirillaceae bacterium]|nr:HD-GYP domain-containing protein [Magnetospirillaceae bacterium]
MKKKIALEQIKAGTSFTEDVYVDSQNLLVPAGIPVKQKDLDTLQKWGVNFVYTEGSQVQVAPSQDAARPDGINPAAFFGDRELYRTYAEMVDSLKSVYDRLARGEGVEPKTVDQISQNVLKVVRDKQSRAVSAILSGDMQGYSHARAGVNTAILSVLIGVTLRIPPYRLSYLATGALLHDAGMLRIPDAIVRKKGQLSEEEHQKMRAHPLLTYRIITKELLYPDDVGIIGLQHHERWDGQGYPRRVAGADIDVLSRIVSVADAFEAMVSEKPYRNSMIGYAAMKAILSDNSLRFDPEILKAFIRSMGIYPIGSLVLLNNAAIARVIETHPDAPLRPKLRVLVDEFGKSHTDDKGDLVDLLAEKSMFIARALDPREVASG